MSDTDVPAPVRRALSGEFARVQAMLDKLEPGQLNPVPVKASKGWGIYRLDSREAIVPRSFERYREELLSGRFDPECPWQPPVSVGATPAAKRP